MRGSSHLPPLPFILLSPNMPGLFDNLSDVDSEEQYFYDSDDDNPLYDYSSSDDIPSDNKEEDPFGGPNLEDPELPSVLLLVPTPTPSLTSLPASSSTLLPLPIRPLISQTSSALQFKPLKP